ncbi:hypothetical protein LCGC14_0400720 [marine sediment metagenome]|uniref:Uncharacterized protein n=1 Tax=marine sediment metagenome TaxID=412755 RepID=A0A0F9VIZ0_9ZZZZ
MTIREIQIAVALKSCRHEQSIKPYLKARRDWRASLLAKRLKKET